VRFLVDQQLPPALADWFRRRGHEADHTEYLGLGAASDGEVWRQARILGAIVVTKDADFAAMRRSAPGPQILWLRVGNASKAEPTAYVQERWAEAIDFLESGEPIVEI
jgi:predicted nuclease of predicted toxin-antitoxin system